jgi:hypothetical protein
MLIPFEPWHVDLVRKAGGFIGAVYPDALERLGAMNLAYTIVTGGEKTTILGFAGAAPMIGRDKTAEVFVTAAAARDEHKLVFARSVRHILVHCQTLFGKLEAACPVNDVRRCKFLEWLGFKPTHFGEGMMRFSMEGGA